MKLGWNHQKFWPGGGGSVRQSVSLLLKVCVSNVKCQYLMKLRYLYAHYIQTDHGLYSHILNICYYGNQTVLPPGDLFYVCVNIDN